MYTSYSIEKIAGTHRREGLPRGVDSLHLPLRI